MHLLSAQSMPSVGSHAIYVYPRGWSTELPRVATPHRVRKPGIPQLDRVRSVHATLTCFVSAGFIMSPFASIAISMLPDLAKRVASNVLPDLEKRMTRTVRDVLGTDDPAEAERLIADPRVASELRVRLAEIDAEAKAREAEADSRKREAELAELREILKDAQSARTMMTDLTAQDSVLAWGPVIVSTIVVVGFFWALLLLVGGGIEDTPENAGLMQIVNIIIGALTAGFATVISFWLGSSQGSRNKDTASLQAQSIVATMQRENTQSTERLVEQQSKQTSALIERVAKGAAPGAAPAAPAKQKDSRQFHRCMDIIFAHEGGYVDHPDDPGGATNLGITHKTLAAWRKVDKCSREEVQTLQRDEAREIYRAHYWNALNCDNLPAGVDLVTFDMGVNAGVGRSSRMLQEVVSVEKDGQVGPITVGAVNRIDAEFVVSRFSDRRLEYYQSLKHWPTFGRGWSRRTAETREAAMAMMAV